jgi:hypothetical protein
VEEKELPGRGARLQPPSHLEHSSCLPHQVG